ncbi:hypothetical protein AHAS_Ahas17G0170400 [Arachis hypogaea]
MRKAGVPSTEGHYDSSEIMPEVNLANEIDPLFQGQLDQSNVNKPSDSMLSREEESVSDPAQQQMVSSNSTMPAFISDNSSNTLQPQKVDESTPTVPLAPSKSDPGPEATAATPLMMARTAFYVLKEFSLPSFSLDFTDLCQEET